MSFLFTQGITKTASYATYPPLCVIERIPIAQIEKTCMWKATLSDMSAYTFLHSEPAAEKHPNQYYLVLRPPLA